MLRAFPVALDSLIVIRRGPSSLRQNVVFWTVTSAVVTVLTAARLGLVASLADQGHFAKYLFFARRILAGELPVTRLGDLSAGYLWLVTALMGCGADQLVLRSLQIAAVSAAALLCAAAADRWGRCAAVVAGLAVLGSRGALVNATEFEPETLILLLHALAMWLLARRTGAAGRTGAGFVLGLSAVTRPTVLLPAAAIALWLGWNGRRQTGDGSRRALGTAALFALGFAAPFLAVRLAYAAFPGGATPMNPGTVLYEGLNPAATGYSGEAPQIVKEIEFRIDQPDALHVAYRLVAARALAERPEAGDTNRFWLDRAVAFARHEPAAAAGLLAAKLRFALTSYESWDLKSMAMRDLELSRRIWIPFGLVLALAVIGVLRARPAAVTIPAALLAAGPMVTMVAFYVTSRQRNALIPPLAVLAAAGVSSLVDAWRTGRRREALLLAVVATAAGWTLSLEGPAQTEDRWGWIARAERDRAEARIDAAREAGDDAAARAWQTEAAWWMAPIPDAVVAHDVCREVGRRLAAAAAAAERFDLAIAARRCGDLDTAESVLGRLFEAGYRPRRGVQTPPSVAYDLAAIALQRGERAAARDWLAVARREAPGSVQVLALSLATAVDGDPVGAWRDELEAVHDPFTARFALAEALAAGGDGATAEALAAATASAIPEWPRPREWLEDHGR